MARLFVALLLSVLALSASPVRAQDPTPEPGPNASRLLPDASALGDGWHSSETVNPDLLARYYFEMSPDVFREGAARIYVGRNGSRIVVVSLLITENRVAIRQSWEDATLLLDAVSSDTSTDYQRDEALQSMDVPAGCVEAKRIEGIEDFVLLPVGGTMCAIDPDAILISVVFGDFNEQTGVEASDAVVGVVLGG